MATGHLGARPHLSATGWRPEDEVVGDLVWMGTPTAPTQDLSCTRLLTSSPLQPRTAGPQSPPHVSGQWEAPPAPADHLNQLDVRGARVYL